MADEVIRVSEEFYILSTSARIDDRTRVLKDGDTFAVFDRFGDIEAFGSGELGIYHNDTRYLSRLTLRLSIGRPVLLSSTIKDDNAVLAVDYTNADVQCDNEIEIPRGTLHFLRSKVLRGTTCHERMTIYNYGHAEVVIGFHVDFQSDFADIFEVRGLERQRRGRFLPAEVSSDVVLLGYEGLDRSVRRTRLIFDPPPSELSESVAKFRLRLEPRTEVTFRWSISCESDAPSVGAEPSPVLASGGAGIVRSYEEASHESADAFDHARQRSPEIVTSNTRFNEWLNRSFVDLHMMQTQTPYGWYPYAGVPWYSTIFGRDGIVTALQCLSFKPSVARGVLAVLAATQARSENAEQDAQPGKILHETRRGEMAVLGEIPFSRYYGTIDATPLFVMLAGAYAERTDDLAFLRSIWPSIELASDWIDRYGDCDDDGFVEYARRNPRGLIHQGWKDSHDAIFHEDGTLADGPIALSEVQGYVYAAKLAMARLSERLGDPARAPQLEAEAKALKHSFHDAFWCDDLSTYALALDGEKRPCRVRSSNAGQCLFTGIASEAHAERLAATLMSAPLYSGWGIRTIAANERGFNPMSYHNGSIWPHDNSLIAAGFGRYGLKADAGRVLSGLFDSSVFFELHRLPELFCGFTRRTGESPTQYPVACSPQAWAAGAVFLMLDACLGMRVLAPERKIIFVRPFLPEFIEKVAIRRLRVGDASVDVTLSGHNEHVEVNLVRRTGAVDVLILK